MGSQSAPGPAFPAGMSGMARRAGSHAGMLQGCVLGSGLKAP